MSFPFLHLFLLTSISFLLPSFKSSFPSSLYNSIHDLSLLSSESDFFANISDSISSILNKSIESTNLYSSDFMPEITEACKTKFRNTFLNENNKKANEFYIHKLLQDSSTNKNEVSAFQRCMRKTYNYNLSEINAPIKDFYFVVLEIDATKDIPTSSSLMNEHWYSLAFCLPKMDECETNDFRILFYTTTKVLKDLFSFTEDHNFTAFTIDLSEKSFQFHVVDIFKSIPLLFMLFQIIICLFNIFPFCLVKKCTKRKTTDYSINSDLLADENVDIKYNKTLYKQIKNCFNKTQNSEEIFNKNYSSSEINNYSGITYTKGLRGINMILFLFGNVFFELFNSYVSNYSEESFITVMISRAYVFFYIGMKYAPRALLSISGFVLYYKMMCFIDDRVEEKLTSKKEEEMKKPTRTKKKRKSNKGGVTVPEVSINLQDRQQEDVPFKIYFIFIAYQLHRYFMFILLALFIRLTIYKLVVFLKGATPFWKQLNSFWISAVSPLTFLFALTTLRSFTMKKENYDFFSFYWILSNEIFFFIIGSLIIFIGYKRKLRIDIFLITSILVLFVCKIVYYFLVCRNNEEFATLYFYFWGFGKFILTPFYNSTYFLMGMFFGSLNYVLQKGITYEEIEKQGKPFLYLPVRYVNFFQKTTIVCVYLISILGLLLILLFSFMYYIVVIYFYCNSSETCFSTQMEQHMEIYLEGGFLNFVYLIDIEIVLFFVHWISFAFYVKGNNFVSECLSFRIWASLDKCYFSFIIALHLVSNYVLAQSETRITFNLENVFLYSLIIGFWLFVVTIISYIFFELPYKRLIRVISKKKEIEKEISSLNASFSEHILISPDMNFDNDEEEDKEQNSQLFDKMKM